MDPKTSELQVGPSEASGPDVWDRLPLVVWGIFLVAIPHLPSQDGPAHLLTGASLVGWLQGEPLPRVLFELRPWFFTNWVSILVLGGLQGIGLAAAWAEKIWLLVVMMPWVAAFARLRVRLGTSRLVPWLVLLLFQGWIARLGLWSFLFAAGVGLWVWSRRSQGALGWLDHLLLLLALVSHPMGPMIFVGLAILEDLLKRRLDGWRAWGPHLLIAAWVVATGADGRPQFPAAEWPDFLGRSLGPWSSAFHPGAVPRLLLLALLLLGAWVGWRSRFRVPERRVLGLAALALVLASSVGPTALGSGSVLRPRMAFLAWALAWLALPLPRERPSSRGRWLSALLSLALVAALVPPMIHSWRLAHEQRALLDTLPELPAGSVVTSSSHSEGGHYQKWLTAPSLHLADRRLAEQGAWDPFMYPVQTEHFPLVARFWLGEPMVNYLHWRPSRVSIEGLAPVLDAYCVLEAPVEVLDALEGRLAAGWDRLSRSDRQVCFASRTARPVRERFREPWDLAPRELPAPVALDPRLPESFVLGTDPSHAHWPWRAFVRDAEGRLHPAGADIVRPNQGHFDPQGRVAIESWVAPDGPEIVVLLSG